MIEEKFEDKPMGPEKANPLPEEKPVEPDPGTEEKSEEKPVEEAKPETVIEPDSLKEEMVTVPKSFIDKLEKRMKAMEEKGDFMADKRAKARWYAAHKKELPPQVDLNTWPTEEGDIVVVDWGTVIDQGEFKDPRTGHRVENQLIWIKLENDKIIKDIPYAIWAERYGHVLTEQIGTETRQGEEGQELWLKLKRKDNGKEYTVPVYVVN